MTDAELIERLREMRGDEVEPGYISYDPLCTAAADRLVALVAEREQTIDRLEATGGHNKPCHNCGTLCNGLAGNPGLWPICLPVEGMPTWFCTACIASMRDKTAKEKIDV